MPRGDGTGPLNEGPMTGRKLGYCADYDAPGFLQGGGSGRGRGWRFFQRKFGRGFFWHRQVGEQPDMVREDSGFNELKNEIANLKKSLDSIMDNLKMISTSKK